MFCHSCGLIGLKVPHLACLVTRGSEDLGPILDVGKGQSENVLLGGLESHHMPAAVQNRGCMALLGLGHTLPVILHFPASNLQHREEAWFRPTQPRDG